MKYCTKCGTQMPDDSKFCTECGSQLSGESARQPVKNKMPMLVGSGTVLAVAAAALVLVLGRGKGSDNSDIAASSSNVSSEKESGGTEKPDDYLDMENISGQDELLGLFGESEEGHKYRVVDYMHTGNPVLMDKAPGNAVAICFFSKSGAVEKYGTYDGDRVNGGMCRIDYVPRAHFVICRLFGLYSGNAVYIPDYYNGSVYAGYWFEYDLEKYSDAYEEDYSGRWMKFSDDAGYYVDSSESAVISSLKELHGVSMYMADDCDMQLDSEIERESGIWYDSIANAVEAYYEYRKAERADAPKAWEAYDAYTEYFESMNDGLSLYQNRFCFLYLDDDKYPELIAAAGESAALYTYKNNKVSEVGNVPVYHAAYFPKTGEVFALGSVDVASWSVYKLNGTKLENVANGRQDLDDEGEDNDSSSILKDAGDSIDAGDIIYKEMTAALYTMFDEEAQKKKLEEDRKQNAKAYEAYDAYLEAVSKHWDLSKDTCTFVYLDDDAYPELIAGNVLYTYKDGKVKEVGAIADRFTMFFPKTGYAIYNHADSEKDVWTVYKFNGSSLKEVSSGENAPSSVLSDFVEGEEDVVGMLCNHKEIAEAMNVLLHPEMGETKE